MNMQTVNTNSSEKTLRLSKVGLKLFFVLSEKWNLTQDHQLVLLGQSSRSTLKNWKDKIDSNADINLKPDTIERLSLIAGIRKGVEILYPENRWDDYMHQPNSAFDGDSLLEIMLAGSVGALYDARRYLDANRGAHFG